MYLKKLASPQFLGSIKANVNYKNDIFTLLDFEFNEDFEYN